MSEQLQKAMAEMIAKLNAAGDFAIDQAPDVIQQFILWERVSVILWLIFAAILWVFGVYCNLIVLRTLEEYADSGEVLLRVVILICAVVLGIACLISGLSDLSAFIAPKYHILKQFI